MQSYLPSTPYPPSGNGYWDPVTSTLNWCEEASKKLTQDYYATIYSAELVNSLTNLAFVYLAYKGISSCLRNGHDTVFLLGFVSYLVIGLGSFCFHSTLKYNMQLLDELAMIYTTCIMFYAVFSHRQSKQMSILIALLAVGIGAFVTAYYMYIKEPLFHQNAFALLTAIVFFHSVYGMEINLRPAWKVKKGACTSANDDAERVRMDRRDRRILRIMWGRMIPVGLGSFALGFLIWNLDRAFCSTIRGWRREIGLPWGILLEGHGWWHIFTGIAQYFNLTWSIWLRYCFDGKQDEVELVWPATFASMPSVEKVKAGPKKRA
ncbi:uncharacterized protein Z518_02609 [Rhinocladiella mackenziei CBS 650.93]|uniref:Rhinocladiella mackenziei CBS 650.93 unplaced genomic scaffold supercont1.2, whole genome shotgun sequence n=1 Tax=Rhinocladiella mackenziei CBS 650.93 TaxID=1442369 RepID=A0A0D2JFE0_9EURO|nr:uncharacterized protein Z518_02609 [Rhinocladiella mackenziei CBS 650.93]KIX07955.1 hypothetical protein Z518_02609 [Rhinocladiella mackenziei CBS 650.93]